MIIPCPVPVSLFPHYIYIYISLWFKLHLSLVYLFIYCIIIRFKAFLFFLSPHYVNKVILFVAFFIHLIVFLN